MSTTRSAGGNYQTLVGRTDKNSTSYNTGERPIHRYLKKNWTDLNLLMIIIIMIIIIMIIIIMIIINSINIIAFIPKRGGVLKTFR